MLYERVHLILYGPVRRAIENQFGAAGEAKMHNPGEQIIVAGLESRPLRPLSLRENRACFIDENRSNVFLRDGRRFGRRR